MYEYWIGRDVDYEKYWDSYLNGKGYIQKYHSMEVHIIRIKFVQQPNTLPLFNFEAVFKTIKGYFHDLKKYCLTPEEYGSAGPLFVYSVERDSGIWTFLGELRQILFLGSTLADEKVLGQKLENYEKKLEILNKYFGNSVNTEDFKRFMSAKTPRQLEKAIQNLIEEGIEKIEISQEPFAGEIEETKKSLIDVKALLGPAKK